jgi:Zn-dependent protease
LLLTYSDLLSESILLFVTFAGAVVTALVTGIAFHEFAHAFSAMKLGDNTARMMGRVTLNPARHLDPAGTFFMLLAGFGWGKPTPVNPNRLRYGPLTGRAIVAAAGPASNVMLAVLAAIPIQLGLIHWWSPFVVPFSVASWSLGDYASLFLSAVIVFNILLCVFNLLPIAPLDGYSVAVGILPHDLSYTLARLEPHGPMILMILIFLPFLTGGQISPLYTIMSPFIDGLTWVIVGHRDVIG